MTVGITFTNGIEAIAITDSRVSGNWRQSDSVDKMGEFKRENYHGVLFGAGAGEVIEYALKRLDDYSSQNPEEYVAAFQGGIHQRVTDLLDRHVGAERKKSLWKAQLIPEGPKRELFLEQELGRIIQEYDKMNEGAVAQTHFILTAYDKAAKKVKHFYIDARRWQEQFTSHHEIGSGADGANLYFAATLQGIDPKTIDAAELLFYVVNAYTQANLNVGVGGTPKIAHVSSKGSRILSVEQARVLTNVSGAYTSRYTPRLTPDRMKKYCGEVLEGKRTSFANIARMLNMTSDSLTTMAIPYSVWQERANSR